MTMVPLNELSDNEVGLVVGFDPEMPKNRKERFEDLGFTPNTPITRERNAPLGDPLLFRIRGNLHCLRRAEARMIQVKRHAA